MIIARAWHRCPKPNGGVLKCARILHKLCGAALVLGTSGWLVSSAYAQNLGRVPLEIKRVPANAAGVFMAKASIPLPQAAQIFNTKNLKIVDEKPRVLLAAAGEKFSARTEQILPAQFTVLSRWEGTSAEENKPIKWLLAEFPFDLARNSSEHVVLTTATETQAVGAEVSVNETATAIAIATGKLSVLLSKKRGTVFEQVQHGNRALVQASPENDFTLQAANGVTYYTGLAQPFVCKVEKSGPQVVTVLVHGGFRSAAGEWLTTPFDSTNYPRLHQPFPYLTYALRYHFYANQDYVTLDFTLENNGVYGYWTERKFAAKQWLYFNALSLNLNVDLREGQKEIASEDFAQIFNHELFELYQSHGETHLAESENFSYRITKNGAALQTGARTRGWFEVNDGAYGFLAAVQHFWQNAPKKISWQHNRLRLHLWPTEGKWPQNVGTTGFEPTKEKEESYQFEGGRHKTHTLLLKFYHGALQREATQTQIELFERPLFGLPASDWIALTSAWPMFVSNRVATNDRDVNEALTRYEQMQRARVYAQDAEAQGELAPATLYTIMEGQTNFGGANGTGRHYGWMNFGDLYWVDGYCSNHYDWPYSMLLHFLRTGKDKLLDHGEVMARHQYDIDHYWGRRTDERNEHLWANGLSRYEKGYHGNLKRSPHAEQQPKATHTWIGGMLLHYLMSGDPQALAAARETVEGYEARFARFGLPRTYELRFQGWSLLNCLLYYNVTGERRYYDLALRLGKEDLLALEIERGSRGYWGDDNAPDKQSMVMFSYVIEPLILLHYFSRDPEILQLLERMAQWLRTEALQGGMMQTDKYWPLETPYEWQRNVKASGNVIRDLFYANLYGYLYAQKRRPEDLTLARKLFRDSMFWYQAGENARVDLKSRSAISMLPRQFPGTHTKIHGWTGRSHQIYLRTEWQTQNAAPQDEEVSTVVQDFYLAPCAPNPFSVRRGLAQPLTIPFGLTRPAQVHIAIYDAAGQSVAALLDSAYAPGYYQAQWDGRTAAGKLAATGIYWVRMRADEASTWRKFRVVR